MNKNKIFILLYCLLLVLSIISIIFTCNNYSHYKDSIVKVIDTEDKYVSSEVVTFGYKEDIYNQSIKAKILNGEDKGQIVNIENEYHKGEAYDQRYSKGDELFVTIYKKKDNINKVVIDGYKRDKYIVILVVSFILIIVLIGKTKGFLSIIGVVLNIIIFSLIVYCNGYKNVDLVLLSFVG